MTRPWRSLRCADLFCVFAAAVFLSSLPVAAQESGPKPIRVESHDVYVPVLVLDKKRINELQRMNPASYDRQVAANSLDFGSVAVSGLLPQDFHLFEDGVEQRIQSVTPDTKFSRPFRDNKGLAEDFVGAGSGIWFAPGGMKDIAAGKELNVPEWPGYLIAYVPPGAPRGSCHKVTVKVDRQNSLVFARTEYCDSADPLKDTQSGQHMQSALASKKEGKIGLSLAAVAFFTNTRSARVQISVEFSPNLIHRFGADCYGLPEIRILGLVYAKNGKLIARFSDFMSRNFSPRGQAMPLLLPNSTIPISCTAGGPSYETQVYLDPGDYRLQLALMDGNKFGRAEIPLTVDDYDGKTLAISGVALAKRYRDATTDPNKMPTALPVNYVPLLSKGFEVTSAADTAFDKTQLLYFYVEVSEPLLSAPPPLTTQVHVRIVDAHTGEVKNDLKPLNAAPYVKPGDSVIPIAGGIHIDNLPNGAYRLEIQATDSAGRATPWRAAGFTVRDAPTSLIE